VDHPRENQRLRFAGFDCWGSGFCGELYCTVFCTSELVYTGSVAAAGIRERPCGVADSPAFGQYSAITERDGEQVFAWIRGVAKGRKELVLTDSVKKQI